MSLGFIHPMSHSELLYQWKTIDSIEPGRWEGSYSPDPVSSYLSP